MEILELEKLMLSKLNGEFTSFDISFNDAHACNYLTAKEFYELNPNSEPDWVIGERQKALDSNSVWIARIYPNTPIGSYEVGASSLIKLIEYLASN